MANVLVFIERRQGAIKRSAREALGVAARLARRGAGAVTAVALGPGAASVAGDLGSYGVGRLFVDESPHLELYSPEGYARALRAAAEQASATIVLLPATAMGRDLAPRAAARAQAPCVSDLVEIDLAEDGTLHGKRPVYSGKAMATVRVAGAGSVYATLRPNVFPLEQAPDAAEAEVAPLPPSSRPQDLRSRTVRVESAGDAELDVAEAPVIVSGGRGLKEAENFKLIRALARALGGAVGASRAVVDAGWIDHKHQVGQTGKVVSPNLYVACGISGAIQHLAGMSSAKVIVAINSDAEAPIFRVATYGIVGDLFEVVPRLTEELEKQTSG